MDDDPTLPAILTALLRDEGYQAQCVHSGTAALREIERAPPDLLVSDVSMPGLDGVALTKELRIRGLLMPIVLISAVLREIRLPRVTFLLKPFDLEDLLLAVSCYFDAAN